MQRRVYIVFKSFCTTQPDGLLCIHSHLCITALSSKLVLLHATFPVLVLTFPGVVLTFLSRAVRQSARKPHKAILNNPGWLSGHLSRARSGPLHLTPYEILAKCNPPKPCLPFFCVDVKLCTGLFLGRNKSIASLFIMLLHQMFLFPTSLLSVL